jgi:nucleotide-binding universal stress UspA family protein
MDYKTILVCLDNSARSVERMEFAIGMAARFGAHLLGVHLAYEPIYPYMPEAGFGPLIVQLEEELEAKRKRALEAFDAAAKRAQIAFTTESFKGQNVYRAGVIARAADLIIVGQPDPDDPETDVGGGFPASMVIDSGRPALLLPYAGSLPSTFSQVVVAWNGSREAARAASDALPLLTAADRVLVIAAEAQGQAAEAIDVSEVDLAAFLARHGVKVNARRIAGVDVGTGDWLLSEVSEAGADLLVAGAYGHSRLREFVLGGVTRTLLLSTTVPLLMSH